jgi:hypothetical protein
VDEPRDYGQASYEPGRGIHVVGATEPDLAKGASLARELKEILAVRRHR